MAQYELGADFDSRRRAKALAEEARQQGNPSGWFEQYYRESAGNPAAISWADGVVNPNLAEWLEENPRSGAGRRALVIGSGLGDDAEALSAHGFDVTAFDISPTAVEWSRKRFANSRVQYEVADLFALPKEWRGRFDLVLESYTLQTIPPEFRAEAMAAIAAAVARGGALLVICRACDAGDDRPEIPWPLTLEELFPFEEAGLKVEDFEDFIDETGEKPVRRFRVVYRR